MLVASAVGVLSTANAAPTAQATPPVPSAGVQSRAARDRLVIAGDLDRLSQAAEVDRAIRDAAPNTTVEIVLAPAEVRIDVAWAMMKALRAAERPTRVHLGLDRLARDVSERGTRAAIHPLALAIALRATERAIEPSARIVGAAGDDASDGLVDSEVAGGTASLIRGEVGEWFEHSLAEAPDGLFDLLWSPRDVSGVARPLAAEPPADPGAVVVWRQARLMERYKEIRTGARIGAEPGRESPLRLVIIDAKTLGEMGVLKVEALGPERELASQTLVPATETLATRARNELLAAKAEIRKAKRSLDLDDPSTHAVAPGTYRRAIDAARNAMREATRHVRAASSVIESEPDVAALAPPNEMTLATPAQRRARWKRELQGVLDDCTKIEEKAASLEEAITPR